MKLVIATSNQGKFEEFKEILSDNFGEIISMSKIGVTEEIPETGDTLEENSLLKARYVKERTPFAALADDTGLCVKALGGRPNVRSARFFCERATHAQNRAYLLELMRGVFDRTAYFQTVLTLILPDGKIVVADGKTTGVITEKEMGERGFGYDSVFYSDELKKTFAQADADEKNRVSHRAKAAKALLEKLKPLGI